MSDNTREAAPQELDLNEILRVRREKLKELQDNGMDPFEITRYDKTHNTVEIKDNFETLEGKQVSVAGRLMSKRVMGKASFCHIQDREGQIQSYVARDSIGEEEYKLFKKLDIGDMVGIKGEVFKTKTGETSIHAAEVTLLSKSLLPLPEKFHGLKDTDLRYRQRYVDLIVNPEVRNTFITRSRIIRYIREFLDSKGFIEVETPILNTIAGGASARPFITYHNTLDMQMYLRIAPELYLKRLIVGGLEKVYEIGRNFRNEGMSIKHNPEFTTIELYEAYTDYHGMMDITEDMFVYVCEKVLGTTDITYQGTDLHLGKGWERISMIDAVKKYGNIDFNTIETDEDARAALKAAHIEFEGNPTRGECINIAFEEKVEDNLVQPTFITDYPVEVSPLAKRKPSDPRLTERFEFFIMGREYGNAFSELNDPIDQKGRFLKQVEAREAGDEEAQMMDDDFINALEYAMPPTGGLGIGVDRLVMLLTDSYSIRDVLLFPTMKPLDK
ncbi:MAG: lysine--tRNA ligase [Ruminococcaceae bacterium]|nr:lysine--tRNA ligase [Oscillospiraceae bacterium]